MKNPFLVAFSSITFLLHSCIFFAQDKPIGQIPFTINSDGHIIISLQINDKPISNFVLDTGASVTVINKDLAAKLNLPLKDEVYHSIGTNGVVGNRKMTQKQQVSLNDKVVLKGLEMMVIDLSHLGKINGLIGFDLFREYVTETNFDTKLISFFKRKGKPDITGYQPIAFVESFCTPEIKLSVSLSNNKSFSGKVFFDTGDSSTPFTFSSPFVKKHNLPSKFQALITTESRGINAAHKSNIGTISSIGINDFRLSEIPVALSNAKHGMLSKDPYMGNLGLEFISKFNFILDYQKKKIYLKPNKSYNKAFEFPLSGINLEEKEGKIFIKSIDRPSEAHEKGLKAGQQLISINGAEQKGLKFYQEALKIENKEVTLVVKLENGNLKTIKIQLERLI